MSVCIYIIQQRGAHQNVKNMRTSVRLQRITEWGRCMHRVSARFHLGRRASAGNSELTGGLAERVIRYKSMEQNDE